MMSGHVSPDQMDRYVNDRLTEAERIEVERQLAACDFCMKLFIAAVESSEGEAQIGLPSLASELPDMEQLERRVVAQLVSERNVHQAYADAQRTAGTIQEKSPRIRAWLQHPVTHYTLAASITLLLLVSGTFSSFSQRLAQFDMHENIMQAVPPDPLEVKQSESWSDKMVDQTGSWLDGLIATRFK